MRVDAKVWIFSAALSFAGCAQEAVEPPRGRPTQPGLGADDTPFNITPPGSSNAGSAGQLGKAGGTAASGGSSGRSSNVGGAGGIAGSGTGGPGSGAGGGGGASAAGDAATNAEAAQDCPSPTRALLANGKCVDRLTEFSVATNPLSIATGSDGQIWFDDGDANELVQLDVQGRVLSRTKYDHPQAPREMIGGSGDVILWYSDAQARTVTGLNKAMQRLPFAFAFAPRRLSLGESGMLWLTEFGKAVYRFSPSAVSIEPWSAEPSSAIVVGPDKNLWFPESGLIGRLIPEVEKRDFATTESSYVDDLCAGPDGALWFVDGALSQVGRMTVDGALSRTFDLPQGSRPFRIIAGPDKALWFTEAGSDKIGRVTDKGVMHYPTQTSIGVPYGITVGPDQNIWFTESRSGKVGRLIPDAVQ